MECDVYSCILSSHAKTFSPKAVCLLYLLCAVTRSPHVPQIPSFCSFSSQRGVALVQCWLQAGFVPKVQGWQSARDKVPARPCRALASSTSSCQGCLPPARTNASTYMLTATGWVCASSGRLALRRGRRAGYERALLRQAASQYDGTACRMYLAQTLKIALLTELRLLQAGHLLTMEGWQSGEDALLARGVRRFGKQHLKIHHYFLPTRSGADIVARIKHLTRPAARPNPVKVCSTADEVLEPLSEKP